MADFPALPLWTDSYLADTRHLTTLQHGTYLLLLMEAWRRPDTSLPNDDELLQKLAGLSVKDWFAIKDTILAFFRLDKKSNVLRQKKLTKEKLFVKKNSKKQRSNAKSRWDKEKTPSHGNAKQDAKSMPNASQTDAPTPTPIPTPNIRIEEPLLSPSETAAAISGWNLLAREVKIPEVQRLTEVRKTKLLKRLSEVGGISGWEAMLEIIRQSPALTGGTNMDWRVNFDWVLEPKNLTKIMEKNYVRKSSGDKRNAASFFDNLDAAIDEHENSGAASGIRDEV